MKNILSLLFSCALLLSLPQLALAQMDQLKDTTPEQYSLYEQKKSEMGSTIMQKIKEKHQASQ